MKSGRFATGALAVIGALMSGATTRGSVAYVTDYNDGTIRQVPDGGGASTLFASGLVAPEGITFTPTGTLYVDNQHSGVIDSVSPTGVITPFVTISGNHGLAGLTSDGQGNLYVSVQNIGVVDKITPAGMISTYATGVDTPQELAFNASGELFVATSGVSAKVPAGGGTASTFGSYSQAVGVAVDSAGNVYASQLLKSKIEEFSPTGADLGLYATSTPNGILMFDASGSLLVAPEGTTVDAVPPGGGTASAYATGFSWSSYIAIAPTPEPSSLGLLGIAAVAMRRGRRRR